MDNNDVNLLKQLKTHGGWDLVVKALEENIERDTMKCTGDLDLDEGEEIKEVQDRLQSWKYVRDLPDEMMEEMAEKPEKEPEDFEVYD